MLEIVAVRDRPIASFTETAKFKNKNYIPFNRIPRFIHTSFEFSFFLSYFPFSSSSIEYISKLRFVERGEDTTRYHVADPCRAKR